MDIISLFGRKKKIIIAITGLFLLLGLLLSLVHPLEYSASNRLLVIQPTTITLDSYSATKSVERISEKLSQIIYTTSFYNKVMNSGFDINKEYFKKDERKKRKQWEDMVETRVSRGSGMLHITVYHQNKAQASQLIGAITQVFHSNGWEYIGSMNIQINEIDTPLLSKWPVRPHFVLNGVFGLIIGFLVSIVYVILSSQHYTAGMLARRALKGLSTFDGSLDTLGQTDDMEDTISDSKTVVTEVEVKKASEMEEKNMYDNIFDDFELRTPVIGVTPRISDKK